MPGEYHNLEQSLPLPQPQRRAGPLGKEGWTDRAGAEVADEGPEGTGKGGRGNTLTRSA